MNKKFLVVVAILVVVGGLLFAVKSYMSSGKPFKINSTSMEPSYKPGDVVTVDMNAYANASPARGDVVIFETPLMTGEHLMSRVIGLPGETVSLQGSAVAVNGKPLGKGDGKESEGGVSWTVTPADQGFMDMSPNGDAYFLMGDRRATARDSRHFGKIDKANILGRVK